MPHSVSVLDKIHDLQELLKQNAPVAIAFSGGIDSGFLCKIAQETLGSETLALTADSESFPPAELELCRRVAQEIGIRHHILRTEELKIEGFRANQVSRCYFCKQELYHQIHLFLKEFPHYTVLDGTIGEDRREQRPGMQAAEEFQVRSLLREVGLTKEEIRESARLRGLSIWDKPALACLSSRIPYGSEVTFDKLQKVQKTEAFFKARGFLQIRVRDYDQIAKLEIPVSEFPRFFKEKSLEAEVKASGFTHLVLDLKGFRSGSMHEAFQLIPLLQRQAVAEQVWKPWGLLGTIQQEGALTLLETFCVEDILQKRQNIVQAFQQAGLPYLTLKIF